LTGNELVERFASIALDQDKAIFNEDNRSYNRLFDQMEQVIDELKVRPGDQRSALLALYNNPNIQVRLKAALATMEVAPRAAR
jgi:hypothetical protein